MKFNSLWIWICFSWLILIPSVYGRGTQDPDLAAADELIADLQYDDAIRKLTLHAQEHPEDFDRVQKRLRKVFRLQEEYNALANELLDVLSSDPANSAHILALTRRLERLGRSRGAARDFLDHTQELAQFQYNRNQLEQILIDGRSLIDQGEYAAAIRRYADGLSLYRDDFFKAGYGDEVEGRVNRGIATITESINTFAARTAPVGLISAELSVSNAGAGEAYTRFRNTYNRLKPELETLISVNNALAETGAAFEAQLELFQEQDSAMGDRSFLSFASRVIYGRANETIQEGMLGAVAGLWISTLSRFESVLTEFSEAAYREGYAATEAENYTAARADLDAVITVCDLAMEEIREWSRFYAAQNPPMLEFPEVKVTAVKGQDYLKFAALEAAARGLVEIESLSERYSQVVVSGGSFNSLGAWRRGLVSATSVIAQEQDLRGSFLSLARDIETTAANLEGYRQALTLYRDPLTALDDAWAMLEKLEDSIFSRAAESAQREYTVSNGDLEQRIGTWQNNLAEADQLMSGTMARHPGEALVVLERLNQNVTADLENGNALLGRYGAEPPRVLFNDAVQGLYTQGRSLVDQLERLRSQVLISAGSARSQAAQAEAYRQEGERYLQEARTALARDNFDTARDRALRSGERFDASLAVQESESLRQTRDTQLVNLGADITRQENEAVIREVRRLVNTARDTYFAGNFNESEELLVRALNRWRRTNVEDDPELSYWLTVVRGAMSLRSGRTIPVTAPLYAEMSQLLSEAKRNYDDGMNLINRSRRPEGLEKFSAARQKTQEVRLMFPVNQEASILELRMDQITDPSAFNNSFQRRLSEAVAGVRRGSVESFADLQNLAEINPRYPGILATLTQAEIDMGYRPRPPNPQSLSRSNELTASARSIIDRNVRSQFPVALEQLNQALLLNPGNNQAMSLKDRVLTELGGGGSVVLSSTAEREYQRAVQELQQGNTLVAMSIVRQLLQDPQNRNSTRILELQRRIESIL
jgi:hypothetical protein